MSLSAFREIIFNKYINFPYNIQQKAYLVFWTCSWGFFIVLAFTVFDLNWTIVTDTPASEIIIASEVFLCIILFIGALLIWNKRYDYCLRIVSPAIVLTLFTHFFASLQWFLKTGVTTHREFFYVIIVYVALFHSRKTLVILVLIILCIATSIMYIFNPLLNPQIDLYVMQSSLNSSASIVATTIIVFFSSLINERALKKANSELNKNKELNKYLDFKVKERTQQLYCEKEKLNFAHKNLKSGLEEASKYVHSMLPEPINTGSIRADWRFIPSESLGGDSFGYHWVDTDKFALYLLDVSGHGVGAALLSVAVLNTLRNQSLTQTDFCSPKQVLEALNRAFPSELHNYMFFTIWYGVYDCKKRILTYASGGHPPAILISANSAKDSKIETLGTKNCAIGSFADTHFLIDKIEINHPHSLYVFSDGVYEIYKKDGSLCSYNDFLEFMEASELSMETKLDDISEYTKNVKGNLMFDDDYTILKVDFT
jgi:sigma-B regulation protein RsbU (phosphoserine phosphatase)